MSKLYNYLNRIRPIFEPEGRLHRLKSVFDGVETFLYVPNSTSKIGVNIHDSIDSKRIMSIVIIALFPALLFGMYNVGYQNYYASGTLGSFWEMFFYGFLALLPKIVVSYVVGLGIEFIIAQIKREEIQEGFLVSGMIIPLIIPIECPLWMLAIAVAFAVIFAKEIFGGTGMNIFNVSLVARAFLFLSYPEKMSGDAVWIARHSILGLGNNLPDAYTCATPLGLIGSSNNILDLPSFTDSLIGLIPGSVGETSTIAIMIGGIILLWTGIASWKTMLTVFLGGAITAGIFHFFQMTPIAWYEHLTFGGFCFGAVFMATDPVTSARTEKGKYIHGFLIGILAILIRVLNPGYPEGMMFAILFMNIFAPTIDYLVVQKNIEKRLQRSRNSN